MLKRVAPWDAKVAPWIYKCQCVLLNATIKSVGFLCLSGFSMNEPSRSIFINLRCECSWKQGNAIFRLCPPLRSISYATFYRLDLFMTISHSRNLALTLCGTKTHCDLPILKTFATGKINDVVVILAVPALPPLSSLVFFFYICLFVLFFCCHFPSAHLCWFLGAGRADGTSPWFI